jgi:AcrR family transcriptional regulator
MARINRIKETENPVNPRDVIAAILAEGLPADDERRTFTILYTAYFALSLTDPALAIGPLVRNSSVVIDVVAAQLKAAQAAGDAPAGLDPDLEALSLLAMSAGLGTSILGGQSSPGQAQAVIDYHLDRLFPASRPALRRAPMKAPLAGRWIRHPSDYQGPPAFPSATRRYAQEHPDASRGRPVFKQALRGPGRGIHRAAAVATGRRGHAG